MTNIDDMITDLNKYMSYEIGAYFSEPIIFLQQFLQAKSFHIFKVFKKYILVK